MAGKIIQTAVSTSEPAKNRLWINPYEGVVRIHAGARGWLPLQGPLFAQINGKVDFEVTKLTQRLETDEDTIDKKQDALTAGYGIEIKEDGTIAVTLDTSLFVYVKELPEKPEEGKEDKIYVVPTADGGDDNKCDEYVWVEDDSLDAGGRWELFGSANLAVELEGYAKKSDFDGLKEYLENLSATVAGLEQRVEALEAGAVTPDPDALAELEKRIEETETQVETLGNRIEEVSESIPELSEITGGDVKETWDGIMDQ